MATPPSQLVHNGQPLFGRFPALIPHVNGFDADYLTAMGQPVSRWRKRFFYKEFQYFGLISRDHLIGCALAHTGFMGIVFVYVFDIHSGKLQEYSWRSPLGSALEMTRTPGQGSSRFRHRKVAIDMRYRQQEDGSLRKQLLLEIPGLALDATLNEPLGYQSMSLCTRAGVNGWVYANKVAGVPVTGQLQLAGQTYDLAQQQAFGHHDFSAGYMRRQTFWNWACFSGRVGNDDLGLNLSCGVNETTWSENCLWRNGELIPVAGTRFDYDPRNLQAPWQVTSTDGNIQLRFTPLGTHRERLNLMLFAANFHQLFGYFDGTIQLPSGDTLTIEKLYGFVEEQYAKW